METILHDIRFGARMLLKRPAMTLIAIAALTLGIGANTAIFSVVHAVLLRSLPYSEPDKLTIVWETKRGSARNAQNVINLGNFYDWKDQNQVFSDMAAFFDINVNLTGDGEPEEVPGQIATTNLFSLLGANPLLGRTFNADDGKQGQPEGVVISYSLWQRRYGGDPQVIGRKITLNNEEAVIIGVMPAGFGWHVQKSSMTNKPAELWDPWQVSNQLRERHGRFASAVARLKPGVTLEQAQAEMNLIASRLEQQYPDFDTQWGVTLVPVRIQSTGQIRKPLLILLGAVVLVLLIACANVANILLTRTASRKKEIAVRAGLGADRWRITRQLLTESMLLSAIGGVCGLVLAWWGTRALVQLAPATLMDLRNVQVNLPVLAFTLFISLVTGILFGVFPAFEASRVDLQGSLKEAGKNIGGNEKHNLRGLFVIMQVALALVLLIGAGLLIKSLKRLQAVDPGFNAKNLLTMRVSLSTHKYDSGTKQIDFFNRASEQMRSIAGVEAVGAINTLPFAGPHSGTLVEVEGQPKLPPGQGLVTGVCVTDVNYFQTMQIPLKRGRLFSETEANEMRHVVVVNETFARRNLPGQDPLGKRVKIYMKDDNVPSEIIGVVGDTKHLGLDSENEAMAYWPPAELPYPGMTIVLRTKSDPTSVAAAARRVINNLDPNQPIGDVNTMEGLLARSIARSTFNTTLLSIFSVVALVMAAVGIYGVMSYSVQQRTHEIGVRMALGAQQRDVLKLMVKQGAILGVIGVVTGLFGAFALTRLMTTLLFEVTTTDKTTFAGVAAGLFVITLLACYVPARRATRVDPLAAIRYE